ncbi:hypothetical protein [Halomicrobium salinisoli]|uniref:hypothetical protein n=1 Tax=Halomicrobium salinisoli TaxID=2878391 RepID=UPI001CF09BF1|nr:hypothetical protein [Halomicrobium salinisoli]
MTGDAGDDGDSEDGESATFTAAAASTTAATGWVVPTLESDLRDRAASLRDAIERADGDYMDFLSGHRDELVVFFAIASEVLDDLGRELFTRELLAAEYRDREGVNGRAVVDELGDAKTFDLLGHYGVVPDDLAADVRDTQDYRARLVHEPRERHRVTDLERLERRIRTAMDAVDELQDLAGNR